MRLRSAPQRREGLREADSGMTAKLIIAVNCPRSLPRCLQPVRTRDGVL